MTPVRGTSRNAAKAGASTVWGPVPVLGRGNVDMAANLSTHGDRVCRRELVLACVGVQLARDRPRTGDCPAPLCERTRTLSQRLSVVRPALCAARRGSAGARVRPHLPALHLRA